MKLAPQLARLGLPNWLCVIKMPVSTMKTVEPEPAVVS
jgi:hypothetical protein